MLEEVLGELLGVAEADGVEAGVILRGDVVLLAFGVNDTVGDGVDVGKDLTPGFEVAVGLADGAAVSVNRGGSDRSGVEVGVAEAAVCAADGVTEAKGFCIGRDRAGVKLGLGVAVGIAEADGAALWAGAAETAEGDEAAAISGFTNVFDGPSGGGVDSDFILVRACSAACLSPMSSQPCSTTVCAMAALTVRGRSAGRPIAITGAGTAITSPRTTARPTSTFKLMFASRSNRKRSIGC